MRLVQWVKTHKNRDSRRQTDRLPYTNNTKMR